MPELYNLKQTLHILGSYIVKYKKFHDAVKIINKGYLNDNRKITFEYYI